jgi:hypothetical protein
MTGHTILLFKYLIYILYNWIEFRATPHKRWFAWIAVFHWLVLHCEHHTRGIPSRGRMNCWLYTFPQILYYYQGVFLGNQGKLAFLFAAVFMGPKTIRFPCFSSCGTTTKECSLEIRETWLFSSQQCLQDLEPSGFRVFLLVALQVVYLQDNLICSLTYW